MKIYFNRCAQCGTKYEYQASGDWRLGYDEKLNSPYYCPDCQQIINNALSTIDRKYEEYWQKTDEVDIDTLLRWRKENREQQYSQTLLPKSEMVFATLYNSKKCIFSNAHRIDGRENCKNKIYSLSYWTDTDGNIQYDEPINITVKMEKNLITGEIFPWN